MKTKIIFLIFIILSSFSCNKKDKDVFEPFYVEPLNDISACGYDDPLNQIEWLNLKIKNGQDPSNIDFILNIWVKKYEGEDIFIIDFPLTSYMYAPYDCSGEIIDITNEEFYNSLSDDDLIYKYEPEL